MVIIAVYRQTVTADKILAIAVAVFIFSTYVIMADCSFQAILVENNLLMRVGAVTGISSNIRTVNGKH